MSELDGSHSFLRQLKGLYMADDKEASKKDTKDLEEQSKQIAKLQKLIEDQSTRVAKLESTNTDLVEQRNTLKDEIKEFKAQSTDDKQKDSNFEKMYLEQKDEMARLKETSLTNVKEFACTAKGLELGLKDQGFIKSQIDMKSLHIGEDGKVHGVGERKSNMVQADPVRTRQGSPVQLYGRRLSPAADDLYVLPAHASRARSQQLHHRLLGGKPAC